MNINLAMPLAPILIFQHFGYDNVRADKTAQGIGKTLLGVALFRKVFDGCQRNRKIIKETNKKTNKMEKINKVRKLQIKKMCSVQKKEIKHKPKKAAKQK